MDASTDIGERIVALLAELGIERAHVAAGGAMADVVALTATSPRTVASLTAVLPTTVAPTPPGLATLVVVGRTSNARAMAVQRDFQERGSVTTLALPPEYQAELWVDVARDHAHEIAQGIRDLVGRADRIPPAAPTSSAGQSHGIRYRVEGSGPPLVVLPLGIAPTQWDAVADMLKGSFTVIRLGGRHLGFMKNVEDRAAFSGYRRMVAGLFDDLGITSDGTVVEVGTGSGALARLLAARKPAPSRIIAMDLNSFFLDEAAYIAAAEQPGHRIVFQEGNAESLPLEDASVDAVFAVTVFEECDADRAIKEMHRVLKPGGRAGAIVRSVDLPFLWSPDIPGEIATKVNTPMGAVGATGCADASLYARFARHFEDLKPSAHAVTFAPPWDVHVGMASGALTAVERQAFLDAIARGQVAGTAFAAQPHHSVVGTKRA